MGGCLRLGIILLILVSISKSLLDYHVLIWLCTYNELLKFSISYFSGFVVNEIQKDYHK